MEKLWEKVDSVLLLNYQHYWKNPFVNKFLQTRGSDAPGEEFEGMLLLRKGKKTIWISHPFNYRQAKKELLGVQTKKYSSRKELQKILKTCSGKKVGYDSRFTSMASFKRIKKVLKGKKLLDVSLELEGLREIKEKSEVEKISRAVKETEKVLWGVIKGIHAGASEKNILKQITSAFEKNGFDTAFCIVAFGENTSHIHHVSGETKLAKEMPVLIDCGAKYKGYVADISRSFWFGKNEPLQYTKAKQKVLACLAKIEAELKDGANVHSLWKQTKVLGAKLPHALGHGIGIEEHDFPSGIGEKCRWALKAEMVLAIEPAIYKKKFGVRIENDYLITKKGFRKL